MACLKGYSDKHPDKGFSAKTAEDIRRMSVGNNDKDTKNFDELFLDKNFTSCLEKEMGFSNIPNSVKPGTERITEENTHNCLLAANKRHPEYGLQIRNGDFFLRTLKSN